MLHAFWANRPFSRTLAKAVSYSGTGNLGTTPTSAATSIDIPGLSVQWVQGNYPVEVTLEGFITIVGVSQAAGLKVQIQPYIADLTDVANHAVLSAGGPKHTFVDTTSGQHKYEYFKATYIVNAAAGTVQAYEGRVFAPSAAATWNCQVIGLANQPCVLTAREVA